MWHSSIFVRDYSRQGRENILPLVTATRQINISKSIADRDEHAREAIRLRSLANTLTTAAVKARVLQRAEEHARLAGHGDQAA